jgi:hypothetical protein
MAARRDTCLTWGPADHTLAALVAFRDQITRQLAHSRKRAASGNMFYIRLVDFYTHELIRVSDQIARKERRGRRKAA